MFLPVYTVILFCSFTFLYNRNQLIISNIYPLTCFLY